MPKRKKQQVEDNEDSISFVEEEVGEDFSGDEPQVDGDGGDLFHVDSDGDAAQTPNEGENNFEGEGAGEDAGNAEVADEEIKPKKERATLRRRDADKSEPSATKVNPADVKNRMKRIEIYGKQKHEKKVRNICLLLPKLQLLFHDFFNLEIIFFRLLKRNIC